MEKEPIVCDQCEKEIIGEPITETYYALAFAESDEESDVCNFCSEECLEEYEDETGAQWCDSCDRRLHDGHGYDINFRYAPSNSKFDGEICNKCFREHVLVHGLALADLEDEDLLNRELCIHVWGDDLKKHGWVFEAPTGYEYENETRERAIKLAKSGKVVLLVWNRGDDNIYTKQETAKGSEK